MGERLLCDGFVMGASSTWGITGSSGYDAPRLPGREEKEALSALLDVRWLCNVYDKIAPVFSISIIKSKKLTDCQGTVCNTAGAFPHLANNLES